MKLILNIFLFFIISTLAAQPHTNAKISNVNFEYDIHNDIVIISFQFSETKPHEIFSLKFECYTSLKEFKINSLSEDTGNISGNGIKTIIWKPRDDGYVFDEEIGIKVNAYTNPDIPAYKHLLRSALIPGLGDYRIRNGWHYISYGIVSYGLIATSVHFNFLASESYNNYKSSFSINESDKLFKQSVQQKLLSYFAVGVAAVIWIADITGVYLKSKKIKKEITQVNSKYYFALSKKPIVGLSETKHLNTKNKYERAIEKGNALFREKNYSSALNLFEEAAKINPDDVTVKSKITETKEILAEIKVKEDLFNKIISEANDMKEKQKYYAAHVKFQEALKLKPDAEYLKTIISGVKKLISEFKTDSLYKTKLNEGSLAYKNKDYENAKKYFAESQKLKPTEIFPTNKINEIDSVLYAIKQKKINDEYNAIIKQADATFQKNQFEKAKELYINASNLNTEIEYPHKQIEKIDSMLIVIEQKKIDKEYIAYLNKGDLSMKNREYDKAQENYEKASQLKPIESYPKKQIEVIDDIYNTSKTYGSKEELFNNCEKAVFLIYSESYWGDASTGTGFFISAEGVAISNYHVYNKYSDAFIYTGGYINNKDELDKNKVFEIEKVLDQDKTKDYVIFKVKKKYNYQKFTYLRIAPQNPKILEEVLAIGNPQSFLKVPSPGFVKQYLPYKGIDDFYVLTNVDVTHGNSGGPLLNLKGEVIGIMTMAEDKGRLGLNYAINIRRMPVSKYLK